MSQPLTPEFSDIDSLLRSTAVAFDYPATPDIAQRVSLALEEEPERWAFSRLARLPLIRMAAAALVAVLVAAAVALATPQSRDALADFFGLSHVQIDVGPVLGPPPPVLSPASFAEPATLTDAQSAVDFALRLPVVNGVFVRPGTVYVDDLESNLPVVILVFEERGYDLYETRQGFFGKGGVDESLLHETSVNGSAALWLDEGRRIARSLDAHGRVIIESERTVDRATLFWEADGVTFRLETSLPEAEAILVAESLQ